MRISDWSSDVCSSDLCLSRQPFILDSAMEQTAIIFISMALALQGSFSGTARVVDGDTLRIGTQRVRLHGIDAPELAQRCGTERRQRCGEMAAAWLKARVEGKRVACTRSEEHTSELQSLMRISYAVFC